MSDDEDNDCGEHPDHETPVLTEKGPMSLQEALVDPEAFFGGMKELQKTYCCFVEIPPLTLRTLMHEVDGSDAARILPYVHLGKSGSLVTTPIEDLFVRIQDRFQTKCGADE